MRKYYILFNMIIIQINNTEWQKNGFEATVCTLIRHPKIERNITWQIQKSFV